jgi:hypothetical protein
LTVSEQSAEQISGEPGSFSPMAAVSDSSEASVQPIVAAPGLVPGQDAAMSDAPTTDAPKSDVTEAGATKTEAPQADPSKVDPSKADTPKAASPRFAGKVLIMSDDERNWEDDGAAPEIAPEPDQGMFGKRWLAVAAMLALAVVAGALGGAMATAGLSQFFGDDVASADSRALEASIARIDADILALKAGVEHTSKLAASQYTRTSDRLDKVEKAQAEPAAKLARLSEAVDKLRATPPAAAAPGAAREVTGSVTPPVPTPAPKPEVGRLPTVEGWVLHDVANGGALVEGRHGRIYEVYAGDPLPGLGRVDAIRRQDGRWVVVTSKGLIVAR